MFTTSWILTCFFVLVCFAPCAGQVDVVSAIIDGDYETYISFDPTCPSKVIVRGTTTTAVTTAQNESATRRAASPLAMTAVNDILFDSENCTGGTMRSLPHEVMRDPVVLSDFGFSDVPGRFVGNRAASVLLFGTPTRNQTLNDETFVSFDDVDRTCGIQIYNRNTFYFTIAGTDEVQEIVVANSTDVTTFLIREKSKVLVIVPTDGRVCIYETFSHFGTRIEDLSQPLEPPPIQRPSCFPSTGKVELYSGAIVNIDTLSAGDIVRTGPSSYGPIVMFTHHDANAKSLFIRLLTVSGVSITLTASHYVPLAESSSRPGQDLVAAGAVRVGDSLRLADGETGRVVRIESVLGEGLYNPQTSDGWIVVDGVVASTYTTAVHPTVAHGLLSIVGVLGKVLDTSKLRWLMGGLFEKGGDVLSAWLPTGPSALDL